MFPANQLCDGNVIAIGFKLQAAQYVGDLTAKFARVQRVPPQFGQGRAA